MLTKAGILVLLAGLLVYWIKVERPKENKKKRERQMMADYPDIIAKLTVLTGAGLSLPQTWMRLTADYEAKRQKTGVRYAYEEMAATGRQIQIGLHAYIKLGNLLEQNMKKGTKGLSDMLQTEAYQAFEERKHQVRRAGEEISTRLLVPMFMMFGVVLVIILVPALLSLTI